MTNLASRDDWAGPLAALVASIRRDWDYPGLRAAIHKARHRGTPADVAMALIRLAGRPELTTPGLLAEDGEWWGQPTLVPSGRQRRCTLPGHEFELAAPHCRICRSDELAARFEAEAAAGEVPAELGRHLTPEQVARNTAWAVRVRAAIGSTPDPRAAAAGERDED